jgi:hypothetical protein
MHMLERVGYHALKAIQHTSHFFAVLHSLLTVPMIELRAARTAGAAVGQTQSSRG